MTDVLLVYIFKGIEFIPDSYTRRLYSKLGYAHTESYDKFKSKFHCLLILRIKMLTSFMPY